MSDLDRSTTMVPVKVPLVVLSTVFGREKVDEAFSDLTRSSDERPDLELHLERNALAWLGGYFESALQLALADLMGYRMAEDVRSGAPAATRLLEDLLRAPEPLHEAGHYGDGPR